MKTIQVEVDDALLEAINQDKDFKAMGVSMFFQGAAQFLLKWKTEHEIDRQYEHAYGDPRAREEFDREVSEWIGEQVWID